MLEFPENQPEPTKTKQPKPRLVKIINALTPLAFLASGLLVVSFTIMDESLWEKQGFQMVIGLLIGNASSGALTQSDD